MTTPKSKRCWLLHDYGLWVIAQDCDRVRTRDNAIIGRFLIQERRCIRCGYTQIKKQEARL